MWVQLCLLLCCVLRVYSFTEVFSITKDDMQNSYYVGNQESNFFIGKRDPSCGFEWTSTDGSTSGDDDRDRNDEILYSVIVADDGFIYATGSTRGNFSSPADEAPNLDAAVVVYEAAGGRAVRQKQYDIAASFDNVASAIVQKTDGLLLVSVYGSLTNVQNSAIFETRLLEINKETLEPQNVYTLTVTTSEFFRVTGGPKILDFIYDDSSNTIVAVGHILGRGILWRYSLDSGSVISQAEWGAAFGSYEISGFTSDGEGAFYVVGSSLENVLGNTDLSSPGGSDFHAYVIRYDELTEATTTETWVRQLDAPGSSQSGSGVTIDPVTGEIVVIGTFDADFEVIDPQTSQVFQVPSITNNGLTDVFIWALEPLSGNFTDIRISDLASTFSEDRANAVQVLPNRRLEIGGVINDGTNGDPVVCDDSKVPSPSPTASGSPSLSSTPSPSPSSSPTPTASQSPSTSPTASRTPSVSPSPSHTISATPSHSISASISPTQTPISTPSQTQSVLQSVLGSPAFTLALSVSPIFSLSPSADFTQGLSPSAFQDSSLSMIPSPLAVLTASASPISMTQAADITPSTISSATQSLFQDALGSSPLPSLFETPAFESAPPSPSSLVSPSSLLQTGDFSAAVTPFSPSLIMSPDGISNSPIRSIPLITLEIFGSISLQPSTTIALTVSPFSTSTPGGVLRISAIPSPSFAQIPSITPSGIVGMTASIGASMAPTSTFIVATSGSVTPIPSTLVVSLSASPDVLFAITTPFLPENNQTLVTPTLPGPSEETILGHMLPSISNAGIAPEKSLAAMEITIFPSFHMFNPLPEESLLPSFSAMAVPGDYIITPSTMVFPQFTIETSYIGVFSPTLVLDPVGGLDAIASTTFEDAGFSPVLPLVPSNPEYAMLQSEQVLPRESLSISLAPFPLAEASLDAKVSSGVSQTSPGGFQDIPFAPSPIEIPEFGGSPSLLASAMDFRAFPLTVAPGSQPVIELSDEGGSESVNTAEASFTPSFETAPIISPSLLPEFDGVPSLQTSPEDTAPSNFSPELEMTESPPVLGSPVEEGEFHAASSADVSLVPSVLPPEPSSLQSAEIPPSFGPADVDSPFETESSTEGSIQIDPSPSVEIFGGESFSETRDPFMEEEREVPSPAESDASMEGRIQSDPSPSAEISKGEALTETRDPFMEEERVVPSPAESDASMEGRIQMDPSPSVEMSGGESLSETRGPFMQEERVFPSPAESDASMEERIQSNPSPSAEISDEEALTETRDPFMEEERVVPSPAESDASMEGRIQIDPSPSVEISGGESLSETRGPFMQEDRVVPSPVETESSTEGRIQTDPSPSVEMSGGESLSETRDPLTEEERVVPSPVESDSLTEGRIQSNPSPSAEISDGEALSETRDPIMEEETVLPSPGDSDGSKEGMMTIDPSPSAGIFEEAFSETRGPLTEEEKDSKLLIAESSAPSQYPLKDELLSTSESTSPPTSTFFSEAAVIMTGASVEPRIPEPSSAIFPSPSALPVISLAVSTTPVTTLTPQGSTELSPADFDLASGASPTLHFPEFQTPNEFGDDSLPPSHSMLLLSSTPVFSVMDVPQTSSLLSPTVFPALIDVSPMVDISFAPIALQSFEQSPEKSMVFVFRTPEPMGIVLITITPQIVASIASTFESTIEPRDDGALVPSQELFTASSQPQATRGVDLNPTVSPTRTPRPTVTVGILFSPTVTVTPSPITSSVSVIPSASRSADSVSSFGGSTSPSILVSEPSESFASKASPSSSVTLLSGPVVSVSIPSVSATLSLASLSSTPLPSPSVLLPADSFLPSPSAAIPMLSFAPTLLPSQSATQTGGFISSTPLFSPSATSSLELVGPTILLPLPTTSFSQSFSFTPLPSLSPRPSLESVSPASLPSASNRLPSTSTSSTYLPSPPATSGTGSASFPTVESSPSTSGIGPSQLASIAPASSSSPTQEAEQENSDDTGLSPSMSPNSMSQSASQATSPPPENPASLIGPSAVPEAVSQTPFFIEEATPILLPTKTPTPLPLLSATVTPANPVPSDSALPPQVSNSPTLDPIASATLSSPSSAIVESSPSSFRSLAPSSILESTSLSPRASQSQRVLTTGSSLPLGSAESSPSESSTPSILFSVQLSTLKPSASAVSLAQSPSQTVTAQATDQVIASPLFYTPPATSPNRMSESQEPSPNSFGFESPAFATPILEISVFEAIGPTRTPAPMVSRSPSTTPNRARTANPSPSSSTIPSPSNSESGTAVVNSEQQVSPAVGATETPLSDLDDTPLPSAPELCCTPEISQSSSPSASMIFSSSPPPAITPTPFDFLFSPEQTPTTSPSPTNVPDFSCNRPHFAFDPSLLLEASNFQRVEIVIQVAGPNLTNACGLNFPIAERFMNLSAVNTQSAASLWFVTLVEDGPPVFSSSSSLVTIEVVNNAPASAETGSVSPSPSPSSGEDSQILFAGSVVFHVTAYMNSLSIGLAEGSYVEYIDSQNIVRRMKEEGHEDIEWTGMITVPRVIDARGSTGDATEARGITVGAIGAASAVTAMIVGIAVLIFKDGIAMATNANSELDPPLAEMV